ncbi:hypothetical protein NDU88_005508 [Pleurodeles waltl]|uniref:Uncharacterized protein n=1 Tax=Pleurodeles waltl TaxID=8319 RepID=A0AAV7QEY3_PLEWA|nr:hypothetical protein NDU88_005508 [Pleurodeles waltl]
MWPTGSAVRNFQGPLGSPLGPLAVLWPFASSLPYLSSALVAGSGLAPAVFHVLPLGFSRATSRPSSLPGFLPPVPLTTRLSRCSEAGAGSGRVLFAPVTSCCADVTRLLSSVPQLSAIVRHSVSYRQRKRLGMNSAQGQRRQTSALSALGISPDPDPELLPKIMTSWQITIQEKKTVHESCPRRQLPYALPKYMKSANVQKLGARLPGFT